MGVPRSPKRLLLFVHYNKWGGLADYVIYLLRRVRRVYSRIVFISNSPLVEEALSSLSSLCDDFIQRENKGFDFFAWKEALYREGKAGLSCYDSVTLMNDTCFGPLFDLRAVYRRMEKLPVDFWGLTNHRAAEYGMPSTNGPVPEHIQSYFICFNKDVVQSSVFWNFWNNVSCETDVDAVIVKYETQLTCHLRENGFTHDVYFDTRNVNLCENINNNFTYYPEIILDHAVPFVKIKGLVYRSAAVNMYCIHNIKKHTKYPISLMQKYFESYYDPDVSISVFSHRIDVKDRAVIESKAARVALHIHVYHVAVIIEILERIRDNIQIDVDIFVTTDSDEKAQQISSIIRDNFPTLYLRMLRVCENRGRDVWPFLQIAPQMMEYDMVGHLHTKKSSIRDFPIIGDVWRCEHLDALLGRFSEIHKAFSHNPKLGIVIPDIPNYFLFGADRFSEDVHMKSKLCMLWRSLKCKRNVNFFEKTKLIFPYGNMFWYRPTALRPLIDKSWVASDIPGEPLADDGTILHALERVLVYVAWSEGYVFRVVPVRRECETVFQYYFSNKYNVLQSHIHTLNEQVHALNEHIDHLRDEKRELIQKFQKLSLKYAHILCAVR